MAHCLAPVVRDDNLYCLAGASDLQHVQTVLQDGTVHLKGRDVASELSTPHERYLFNRGEMIEADD